MDEELINNRKEELKRLWNEEVCTTDFDLGFDHYITMTEERNGKRYPIVVGVHENGIADGEIIDNNLFEEIVTEASLDFDADVPRDVEAEIERINEDARDG